MESNDSHPSPESELFAGQGAITPPTPSLNTPSRASVPEEVNHFPTAAPVTQPQYPASLPEASPSLYATPIDGPSTTFPSAMYSNPPSYGTYEQYDRGNGRNGMMAPFSPEAPNRRGWGTIISALIGAVVAIVLLLAAFALGHSTGTPNSDNSSNSTTNNGSHAALSAPTVAVPATALDLQQTVINVVQTDQPSVVEITGQSNQGGDIGSGVVVRSNGYIVTNDHVVSGFSNFMVTLSNGSQVPAQVVGQDPSDDLAVLKISANNLRAITLANSSSVQVGEFAIALGNPLGLQQSATFGIVSALNRTADEGQGGTGAVLTGLVQTSAPINPGNSGGALVDLQGRLIGIPTLGESDSQTGGQADGIGFAIPASRVSYVVNQLISTGHITATGQGFLGIEGEDVTPQLAAADGLSVQSGVLVAGFSNDAAGKSPAQQAGIRQGDVIVSVNGTQIGNSDDLAGVLLNQAPSTKVSVVVERGSGQKTFTVTLGERPTNP
jgi:S1-C subfamily serine protease